MLNTIQEFAVNCSGRSSEEIYDIFEVDATDFVRDEVMLLAGIKSCEPVREGLNKLGYMFGIKSLIEY